MKLWLKSSEKEVQIQKNPKIQTFRIIVHPAAGTLQTTERRSRAAPSESGTNLSCQWAQYKKQLPASPVQTSAPSETLVCVYLAGYCITLFSALVWSEVLQVCGIRSEPQTLITQRSNEGRKATEVHMSGAESAAVVSGMNSNLCSY